MKIENLNFSYEKTPIFSNFNLDIEDGKITTILGKSGVGKTTLLKCIAGIEKSNLSPVNVSFVFQEDRLISHLTIFENLSLMGYDKQDILDGLEKFGLLDKANSYPKKLSGGEKKRINILRAFLKDCDICLLDEPFSSLDLSLKIELLTLLKNIQASKNKTLLYITHDVEESLLISDRIMVLDNNSIKLDLSLTPANSLRNYGSLVKEREKIINSLL